MMNPYDQAHELARGLKASGEYTAWLESRNQIELDQNNREMLKELRSLQWEMEMDKALGREVNTEKQQRLQQLTGLVSLNPALQSYLGAEYRFAQLLGDVQKIMVENLKEWFMDAGEVLEKMER